jgi:hypothetical protein
VARAIRTGDALTGFIVHSEDQAVEAVRRVGSLDRARIRGEFERRFTARRMAQNYLKLYAGLARGRQLPTLMVEAVADKIPARSLLPHGRVAAARTRDGVAPPTLVDAGVRGLQ